ncbi:thioredoxin family protein [Rudaea sp.]|uniref:thioredoxin family protein n=1 Tax=Rudaea sp. TaxID=2136325 RepID=UPI002ED3DDA4
MQGFLFRAALICGLLVCSRVAHAEAALTDVDAALKIALTRQQPMFIDFSAIWCHSCHAMDAQVLNGTDWDSRQDRFVLVRSDADSVNGAAWMKKLGVPTLPTYVVLNPDGSERGRLTGEMKRADFYPAFDRLLSGEDSLAKLNAKAAAGSIDAAAKVLRAYDERKEPQKGLDWYAKLPEATRKAVQGDGPASIRLAIVEAHAAQHKMLFAKPKAPAAESARLAQECRARAQQVLDGKSELEDRFDMARTLLSCARDLPPAQKSALASAQLPVLKPLYENEIPNAGSGAVREATYTMVQIHEALGDKPGEQAAYDAGIAMARKALNDGHGGIDVKEDRSMAEVHSELLSRTDKRKSEYSATLKTMVEAYPDDFFCQYQYGRDLLANGHAAEALPYLERASKGASDTWKLSTAYAQAKALVALQRRAEAEKLFNEAMRKAEAQFPEQTRFDKQYMKL